MSSRWRTSLHGGVAAAGDLLLGAVCPGCSTPGLGLCPTCRAVIDEALVRRRTPDPCPVGMPVTLSCAAYEDPYRSMITAHKEDGVLLLAPVLADLLARSVTGLLDLTEASDQSIVVVPMPSAAAAVRRRGYDATGTIARRAASRLRRRGLSVRVSRLLSQRRTVRDQAGLNATQRQQNLDGGLRVRRLLRPAPMEWLVLVDDVVTTGSTLAEAGQVLTGQGFRVLGAAVVAATSRRPRQPVAQPVDGLSED